MKAKVIRLVRGIDELSSLHKQLPFAVLYLAAVIMSMSIETVAISSMPALISGFALVVGATALACILGRLSMLRFAVISPSLDFLAAGLLRHGTGESHSIYGALVLLPVLWFAALPGRRNIFYAVLGTVLTLLVPFVLGARAENNPNEFARGLYLTLVFAIAAVVVNGLAARARHRLTAARAETADAEEELSRAAQIQRFLLPQQAAILAGYETAGACIPSKAVGGDFFDWYAIDGGLGFTLGDVMGKGAGAGMIAATTRAVIRSARNSDDPVQALMLTSDCLTTDLSQAAAFATLFHARLRAADGRVLFADAGHGLSLLVRAGGSWERLSSRELPVGLMPEASWTSREITLAPGDMIVSCSDGVLDLYDGTLGAIDEVAKLACSAASAQDIVNAIRALAELTSNTDDVTVLAIRRADPDAAGSGPVQSLPASRGGMGVPILVK